MAKRYVFTLSLIAAFFLGNDAVAQDPQFTQFYANPLYLNPAMAGTYRCPRINMSYRNQWPDLRGDYITYSASYDQHVDALSGGLGFMIWNDQAGEGTIETTSISGIYSYEQQITRHFSIRAGFQASFFQRKLDWSKLTFGDQIDAKYGFIYPTGETRPNDTKANVDLSAGILGFSKRYYVGFAVHHLTEPDEGWLNPAGKLPRKYTGHAGALIALQGDPDNGSISPNILFKQQEKFRQVFLGMYLTKGPLVAGLWYRHEDSFILLAGLQTDVFKLGYSYDVTVSRLTVVATKGSHEVSMGLNFDCRPKKRRYRTISCPSF